MNDDRFDPRAMLAALERQRVGYVVIGALARVLHGTDEVTDGVDICPQRRPANLQQLSAALAALGAQASRDALEGEQPLAFQTTHGLLQVVPMPTGTRGGWDDLRRAANREAIGDGLRVSVASLDDLLRMAAAFDRDHERDLAIRRQLRRLVELERGLGLEL